MKNLHPQSTFFFNFSPSGWVGWGSSQKLKKSGICLRNNCKSLRGWGRGENIEDFPTEADLQLFRKEIFDFFQLVVESAAPPPSPRPPHTARPHRSPPAPPALPPAEPYAGNLVEKVASELDALQASGGGDQLQVMLHRAYSQCLHSPLHSALTASRALCALCR